ncbi:MAG: hypothetical protein ACK5JI_03560 [Azonexus sp.]
MKLGQFVALGAFAALHAHPAGASETAAAAPTGEPQRAGPGVIVPLSPPETLMGPQIEQKAVFGNFQYDSSTPDRSFDATLRSMFENYRVSGPGRASSFLEPGSHWLHDVELNTRQPVGDLKTEFNAILRYTDSQRHDPAFWSLQRLQFVASDAVNHLTVGDYYATLSQYSLNQSIKGIGYQRNFGGSTYARVLGGTFAPRWDHLFGKPYNETIRRNVAGLRVQNSGSNYRLGFNLVSAADDEHSSVRTFEDIYRQTLPAVDWEWRSADGSRLSGEHALASTRRQDHNGKWHDLSGTAHRLEGNGNLGKLRWRLRGERVSSDFYSMGGGAVVDRLHYYLRGDYQIDKAWSVFIADDWYRDNLDGQLGATTRTHIPEAGLSARGLFDRRNFNLTAALRQRRVETAQPQYQRHVSERLFVSVGDRFGEVSLRGEIEALLNRHKDNVGARTHNDDYLYRFSADSRHLFAEGRYDLRPYLTVERQVVEDPLTGKTVLTHGTLLDLRLLAPGNLSYAFNFERRHVDNNVPGANSSDLLRYAFSLTARPAYLRGGNIRAEIGKAHYDFSSNNMNYRERYLRVMLDVPFSLEK